MCRKPSCSPGTGGLLGAGSSGGKSGLADRDSFQTGRAEGLDRWRWARESASTPKRRRMQRSLLQKATWRVSGPGYLENPNRFQAARGGDDWSSPSPPTHPQRISLTFAFSSTEGHCPSRCAHFFLSTQPTSGYIQHSFPWPHRPWDATRLCQFLPGKNRLFQ